MRDAQLDGLVSLIGETYFKVQSMYAKALALTNRDTAWLRGQRIVSGIAALSPTTLTDTTEIFPKVRITFEGKRGYRARVSAVEHDSIRALRIEPVSDGPTDWLGIDITIPWEDLRGSAEASIAIYCRASQEAEGNIRVSFFDRQGTRHEALKKTGKFKIDTALSYINITAAVHLEKNLQIDEKREPVIRIRVDPTNTTFDIADLSVTFV